MNVGRFSLRLNAIPPTAGVSLIERLSDGDSRVRERARLSLLRMSGTDPAPGEEGAAAVEKWRAYARQRGWIP